MSEGKRNIIAGLIQEYDIKLVEDIQEALKDLLGNTIHDMLEAELDEHLGYEEYERSDNTDYRNGVKSKKLRSTYGERQIYNVSATNKKMTHRAKSDIMVYAKRNH